MVTGIVVVGDSPQAIAITPDGKFAYVANAAGDSISVIDTSTNMVTTTINLAMDATPVGIAITPDGKFAYVADRMIAGVDVIDTSTNVVTTTVNVVSGH